MLGARVVRAREANAWRAPSPGRGALLFLYQINRFVRGKMRPASGSGTADNRAAIVEARSTRVRLAGLHGAPHSKPAAHYTR